MQTSPLQLKQHFFTKLLVEQRDKEFSEPAYSPIELNKVGVVSTLEFGHVADEVADPRHYMVRLALTIDEKREANIPYDISVEILGFFEIAASIPIEKRRDIVLVNGAAILYSAIREMLVTVSSRFMKGFVTLPSVNFVDNVESKQNAKNVNTKMLPKGRAKRGERRSTKP